MGCLVASTASSSLAAAPKLGDRALRAGTAGADVTSLQKALIKSGFKVTVDGQYGTDTVSAVKRFQRAARLEPSGTAGRRTVTALKRSLRATIATVNSGGFDPDNPGKRPRSLGDRIPVRPGMSGQDIRVLQDFLRKAGFTAKIDGEFGAGTKKAVEAFELETQRTVNGFLDAGDIDALRMLIGEPDLGVAEAAAAPAQPPALAPGDRATVGPDGLALAPANAPEPVKAIIAAGNQIAKMPYRYGGGHGSWNDTGYDCSGSVSFALHGAGLLDSPLASGDFIPWGDAGVGQWVTLYTKSSHIYMIVAGLRFDTSGRSTAGTRWQTETRSTAGYVARHPAGL